MAKTLMYRLFGLGRIPKQAMAILETEGIVYQEEEIPASISFRNFRSPSRRSGYRRNWFSGSIVITKLHFLAFAGTKTMIGLSWDDEKLGALSCTMDDKSRLRIDYDASTSMMIGPAISSCATAVTTPRPSWASSRTSRTS